MSSLLNFERIDKMKYEELYDEISELLTNYEADKNDVTIENFYSLLVKIQLNWEYVVAAEDNS